MSICPKCGGHRIVGPKYQASSWSRIAECLAYTCVTCGYSETRPTKDAPIMSEQKTRVTPEILKEERERIELRKVLKGSPDAAPYVYCGVGVDLGQVGYSCVRRKGHDGEHSHRSDDGELSDVRLRVEQKEVRDVRMEGTQTQVAADSSPVETTTRSEGSSGCAPPTSHPPSRESPAARGVDDHST